MPKNKEVTISDFYCVHCGKKGIDITRKIGKQREAGHLKKLYCIHCKEEWNFAEVRPFGDYNYEDFLVEFRKGNFDNKGNRILPYRQFFAELREKEKLNNE